MGEQCCKSKFCKMVKCIQSYIQHSYSDSFVVPSSASLYFLSCIYFRPKTSASRKVLGFISSPAPVIVNGVFNDDDDDDDDDGVFGETLVGRTIPNGVDVNAIVSP